MFGTELPAVTTDMAGAAPPGADESARVGLRVDWALSEIGWQRITTF